MVFAYEVFRPKGDTYYHPLEFWAQFLRLVLIIYAVLKGKNFPVEEINTR